MNYKKKWFLLAVIILIFSLSLNIFCMAEKSKSSDSGHSSNDSNKKSSGESSLVTSGQIPADEIHNEFKTKTFSGVFISPKLYKDWSQTRFDNEFKRIKEYGVDTIIMDDSVFKNNSDEKWTLNYPSKLSEFDGSVCETDLIKKILDVSKKYDIKVYLGIGNNGTKFLSEKDDLNKDLSINESSKTDKKEVNQFKIAIDMSAKIADEIYKLYKKDYADTFSGFYFPYDISDFKDWDSDQIRNKYIQKLSENFNILINQLSKIDKEMPLIFSEISSENSQKDIALKENVFKFYTDFFKKTDFRKFDIFAPKDNYGNGISNENFNVWLNLYSSAIKYIGDKFQIWYTADSFVKTESEIGQYTTMPINKFIEQLSIIEKYSSKILNSSYFEYLSPYITSEGFDKSYYNYLKTGYLDDKPPEVPKKIKTSLTEDGLFVKWTASTDEFDIAQYIIEKMNSFEKKFDDFKKNAIRPENHSLTAQTLKTEFYDKYYNKNSKTVYRLRAEDCAGNLSDMCYIVVDNENLENNVSLETEDGEKGYLTQAEFDEMNLKAGEINSQNQSQIDDKIMLKIVTLLIIAIAIVAFIIIVLMNKKNKNKSTIK